MCILFFSVFFKKSFKFNDANCKNYLLTLIYTNYFKFYIFILTLNKGNFWGQHFYNILGVSIKY